MRLALALRVASQIAKRHPDARIRRAFDGQRGYVLHVALSGQPTASVSTAAQAKRLTVKREAKQMTDILAQREAAWKRYKAAHHDHNLALMALSMRNQSEPIVFDTEDDACITTGITLRSALDAYEALLGGVE